MVKVVWIEKRVAKIFYKDLPCSREFHTEEDAKKFLVEVEKNSKVINAHLETA